MRKALSLISSLWCMKYSKWSVLKQIMNFIFLCLKSHCIWERNEKGYQQFSFPLATLFFNEDIRHKLHTSRATLGVNWPSPLSRGSELSEPSARLPQARGAGARGSPRVSPSISTGRGKGMETKSVPESRANPPSLGCGAALHSGVPTVMCHFLYFVPILCHFLYFVRILEALN